MDFKKKLIIPLPFKGAAVIPLLTFGFVPVLGVATLPTFAFLLGPSNVLAVVALFFSGDSFTVPLVATGFGVKGVFASTKDGEARELFFFGALFSRTLFS